MAATLDTPLARLLHARGLVALEPLRQALEEVRADRPDGATLAQRLVARGLLSPGAAEAALRDVGERAPTLRAARPPEAPGSPWAPGAIVGEYRVVRRLGSGGMGTVFEAVQVSTGARRALKTLHAGGDPELRLRFQREAELLARVDGHPHVVRVHAAFEAHGCQVLVMDLLPGRDLLARLASGPLPPAELVPLAVALASGLDHLHRRGVLHRDLKPHNVMFDERGTPLLVDFGLASAAGLTLTATGELLGTPAYMAPEQASGDRAAMGPALDVYGLAALLFHAATGSPPYTGRSVLELLAQVCTAPPPSAAAHVPGFPPALDEALRRGLAKRPADRPPDAPAFAASLVRALGERPAPRRSGPWALAAAAAVALGLATAAVAWTRRAPPTAAPTASSPLPRPTGSLLEADGWRLAWSLAAGPRPTLAPAILWADAEGREAAPLERLGDPAAVEAAFEGKATLRPDGRVRVDYSPPRLRWWRYAQGPWSTLRAGPSRLAVTSEPAGTRLVSPDDDPGLQACVGDARWRGAHAALTGRTSTARGLSDELALGVAFDPLTERGLALRLRRRDQEARCMGAVVWLDPPRPDAPTQLVLRPGGPAGERATLDGQRLGSLDDALGDPAREGRVALVTLENDTTAQSVVVEGEPLAVDVPARARPPGDALRVAAAFSLRAGERPLTEEGGPFVALGAGPDELRLELAGWRVVLSRGGVPVAVVAAVDSVRAPLALEGALALARARGRVTCAADLGGRRSTLELPAPFQDDAPAAPSYGSTGRRVTFTAVAMHDAAPGSPDDVAAIASWRRQAAELRKVLDLPVLTGRGLALRLLVESLERLIPTLDEGLAADARARLLVARAAARQAQPVRDLVVEHFSGPGGARARAALDALVWRRGAPALLDSLLDEGLKGQGLGPEEALSLAELAPVLLPDAPPERLACALAERLVAAATAARGPARGELQRALDLFDDARALGAPDERVEPGLARALVALGLDRQALVVLRRVAARRPTDPTPRLDVASALARLGQGAEALEVAVEALVLAPRSSAMGETLRQLMGATQDVPAHRAMVLRAVGFGQRDFDPRLEERIVDLAGRVLGEDRDRAGRDLRSVDLAAWATRYGDVAGDRPTAVLARVRAANDPGPHRDELRRAAAADPLVRALASLDPLTANLLR